MKHPEAIPHEGYPDTHHDIYSRTIFGFWIYILTDFILFGTLLATYSVLHKNTFGGPSASDIFHLPFIMLQTFILLLSSLTIGLGGASAHRKNKNATISLFAITFVLGIAFIGMELADFIRLVHAGSGWQRSAFLSAFFTLLGTHGVHMIFAVIWIIVLIVPVWREGITSVSIRRLTCLKMFWQFLNIIWVFIFSFLAI